MNLLIHGHPGSRLGFVAAVLQDRLLDGMFDVGAGQIVLEKYVKLHKFNQAIVSSFTGHKICINTTFNLLHRHFFLFFQKNILSVKNYEKEVFENIHSTNKQILDKLYCEFNLSWLPDSKITQHTLYDYCLDFEQTFDVEFMCNLYFQINQTLPSSRLISAMQTTNQVNSPYIDQNHSCRVSAEIIKFEHVNNFTDQDRSWQLEQICKFDNNGVCLDPDNLHNNVMSILSPEFYQGPVEL